MVPARLSASGEAATLSGAPLHRADSTLAPRSARTPMRPSPRLLAFAVPLIVGACGATEPPRSYGESLVGGRFTADGVELPASRWVRVEGALGASRFGYRTSVGDVVLRGADGDRVELEVLVYETEPGDARVRLEGGTLVVGSRSTSPVGMTHLRGSIPRRASVDVRSGSGRIELEQLDATGEVAVSCSSGEARLEQVSADTLRVTGGGGALQLWNVRARRATADSESASIQAVECRFGELVARSVRGGVVLRGGDHGIVRIDSPEGDVLFERTRVVDARGTTVSGRLETIDAVFVEPARFTGLGGEALEATTPARASEPSAREAAAPARAPAPADRP